jgi:phosphoribosylamine---glycine ligase
MKILVIGGGGREHAIAWKAAQSPLAEQVFVAPGNGGTALEEKLTNVAIADHDIAGLLKFAQSQAIDLTIVGPETPLAAGVVDTFIANGLACFGPTRSAARLESSKCYSKEFMKRHHIPTAAYATFNEIKTALTYLKSQQFPLVIKADGLAAGKGVIIAQDPVEAEQVVIDILQANRFGDAGSAVVIEEFLQGEEASFIVMVDGEHVLPLATSQDHKARDNADKGLNTGGMGAYSPAPVVTPTIYQDVIDTIVIPTVRGMRADGEPYVGFLYVGLMIDEQGHAKVLEYNCRLGDPETQPIMLRLQSDLVQLCLAALVTELDKVSIAWDPRPALGVVLCAGGYPEYYRKGDLIRGLSALPAGDHKVFHAGTSLHDQHLYTNGGRVLCVTALGATVIDAQTKAYQLAKEIKWNDMYYRTDIGHRAVTREQQDVDLSTCLQG